VVQPLQGTTPAASPSAGGVSGDVGGGQVSAGAVPDGALPVGAAGIGVAAGARGGVGRGADTVRAGHEPSATLTGEPGTPDSVPLGGLVGIRAAGETDKEHKRKYTVVERHDEVIEVAPPVTTRDR
jgi:hypothetical protein